MSPPRRRTSIAVPEYTGDYLYHAYCPQTQDSITSGDLAQILREVARTIDPHHYWTISTERDINQ